MGFNLTDIELTLRAKASLAEYLALPDRGEITSRMHLVNSASDAVRQIQDALMEAWRIRRTLADSWSLPMQQRVGRLLDTQVGNLSLEEKIVHPLFGPILAAMYPGGITQHAMGQARLIWEDHDVKAEARKTGSSKAQKEAGIATTRKTQHKAMVCCVQQFVRWVEETGVVPNLEAASRFPKIKGMVLKRSRELLRTLIAALNQPSVRNGLLEILQKQGFPNATQQAVDDSMAVLENFHIRKNVFACVPLDAAQAESVI